MKKILLISCSIILMFFVGLFVTQKSFAADPVFIPIEGTWVVDPEVTFTGKNAARAKELLNWTLNDYRWTFTKPNERSPLVAFWEVTRNIIYAVFILFVIATAFILIATRGKSLSAMRFIPRFFAIVLLVTFSFTLISMLYQATDLLQGFFLTSQRLGATGACPPSCISQEDLFYIDWDYDKFVGYRRVGEAYAESAFINLLLVKLTAFTYFAMVGTLFIRKIILWFFIILSPVFPLLLLYYPVRNTGKIWIGEFFRWLLYAPLFAIFLAGLVKLWSSSNNIPLNFILPDGELSPETYPTATSILIGGPQMILAITNSANNVNTFALYVVALLMLWMVILLPWVLLQIFLEYAMGYNYAENPAFKGLMGWANRVKTPPATPPPPPPPPRKPGPDLPPMKKPIIPPPPPAGTGLARTIPTSSTAVYKKPTLIVQPMPANVQTLRMTNLSVPSMRDVARFETAMVANKSSQIHEISRVQETLEKLGNPTTITNTTDQARFTELRQKLISESNAGNLMASTIMNASNTMNVVKNSITQVTNNTSNQVTNQIKDTLSKISRPESITNAIEKQKYVSMNQALTKASQSGDKFASTALTSISTISQAATPEAQKAELAKLKTSLVEEKQKGNELAKQLVTFVDQQATPVSLPTQNNVQTVSLEDYEAVRKMWQKNYQTLDVPQSVTKGQISRKEWIQDDINDISKTINMLSSTDAEVVDQGLQEVSNILPFLMMGGFTLPEITAYLKAKQQAATDSLEQVKSKDEEEESLIDSDTHTTTAAVMHRSATIPTTGDSSPAVSGGTSSSDDDDDASLLSGIKSQVAHTSQAVVNIFPSIMNAVKLTPNSTPSLKDVVSYESSMLARTDTVQTEVTKTQDLLTQLSDPTLITVPEEREKVIAIREQLLKESQAGNQMATSIIQAATTIANVKNMSAQLTTEVRNSLTNILSPEKVTDSTKQQQFKEVNQLLMQEKAKGDAFATNVYSLANVILKTTPNTYNEQMSVAGLKVKVSDELKKGTPLAAKLNPLLSVNTTPASQVTLPKENKVQSVSLEDYEAVKKLWEQNYQTMDVPQNIMNGNATRKDWVNDDIAEITRIINLLSSSDPAMVNEGIAAVSHILPFLLIGGFSMSEIIAYLKAKLEAAKSAIGSITKAESEEEQTAISTSSGSETEGSTQTMEASMGDEPVVSQSVDDPSDDLPLGSRDDEPLKTIDTDGPELKELGNEPTGPKELEELEEK